MKFNNKNVYVSEKAVIGKKRKDRRQFCYI